MTETNVSRETVYITGLPDDATGCGRAREVYIRSFNVTIPILEATAPTPNTFVEWAKLELDRLGDAMLEQERRNRLYSRKRTAARNYSARHVE